MKKALVLASVASVIQQFNLNNIKLLQDLGYEVEVACNMKSGNNCSDEKIIEMQKLFDENNIKYYHIDFPRNPISTTLIKANKQLKDILKNQYDLVHCHTPVGGLLTRINTKKYRKLGTRVIYTAHGFHFFKGAPIKNWMFYYPIEKYLAKFTDDLITINKEDYLISKTKFKAKHIHYIPGVGVDKSKFDFNMLDDEKNELREELGLKHDDKVLIYVGELSKRKNQMMIIKSLNELLKDDKNYKLLLVGKDGLNGLLQKYIVNNNLDKNILFLGYRTDIPSLFKISDLVISTSLQEGLPVNLLEAQMSSKKIIATNCRGNRDCVSNSSLVEINDIDTLSKKIKEFINKDDFEFMDIIEWELDSIMEKTRPIYDFR